MADDILGTAVGNSAPPTSGGLVNVNNNRSSDTDVEGVNPESHEGYIAFSAENVNVALWDTYTGGGGYLGNVGQPGFKSYIVAKLTENFYQTRVSMSQDINFFAPYIDAKVDPVFSIGVADYAHKGEAKNVESDAWLDFTKDATGTGKSLNELRISESVASYIDGVSYIIMDKAPDEYGVPKVIEQYKTAKDVDAYTVEKRSQRLETITFWETPESVTDGTGKLTGDIIYVKRRWEPGGFMELVSDPTPPTRNREDLEFKERDLYLTGVDVLTVYPMFSEPAPMGDYKPDLPKSFRVARICCMIFNLINNLVYIMFKQAHGLYVFQGNLKGMRDPLSNIVTIPANNPGETVNMPTILEPSAELPRAHYEFIEKIIGWMVSTMGNNGVSVVEKKAESGASKAFDMVGTNQTNLKTVEINQKADIWRKKIFDLFEDRPEGVYDYETVYPKDFFPSSQEDPMELRDTADWFKANGMPILASEIVKTYATSVLHELSHDKMSELLEEVDEFLKVPLDDTGAGNPINNQNNVDGEE